MRVLTNMRPVTFADASLLAKMHKDAFTPENWSETQIAESLALPTTQGWLALAGERAAGFILCQVLEEEIEILAFCVLPDFRRLGIGLALLRDVVTGLRKGIRVYLEVAEDNQAACSLYERLGFKITRIRSQYYQRKENPPADAINYVYTAMC
jgi:[ribosomal protein S18]-alanine N-acetyltransferase